MRWIARVTGEMTKEWVDWKRESAVMIAMIAWVFWRILRKVVCKVLDIVWIWNRAGSSSQHRIPLFLWG